MNSPADTSSEKPVSASVPLPLSPKRLLTLRRRRTPAASASSAAVELGVPVKDTEATDAQAAATAIGPRLARYWKWSATKENTNG